MTYREKANSLREQLLSAGVPIEVAPTTKSEVNKLWRLRSSNVGIIEKMIAIEELKEGFTIREVYIRHLKD